MDPFKLLKTDHQKVSQLFTKIESASGTGKAQLFTQLKSELDLHAHIEEKFLYPALENKEPSREITLEAYEEHKVVKDLLAELASQSIDDAWDAKLTVLKENVEHHVEEEEGELFDKAEKVLGNEQIERLGAEMEAEKAAQTNGNPSPGSGKGKVRSTSKKASAKSRNSKSAETPGVLQRLANLVGIGTAEVPAKKAGGKKAAKKTTKKSSKKVANKAAKKTSAKKTSAKSATKTGAARKSANTPAARATRKSAASPSKRTSKKSASKKR